MTTSTPKRVLFNLFWAALPEEMASGALEVVPKRRAFAFLPAGRGARLMRPPPIEAIILYPAFLTPAVVSRDVQNFFEVLLLGPSDPVFNAELVNRHLKISRGLDPRKWATRAPLFKVPPTKAEIEVERLQGAPDGILATKSLFRGVVDKRFWEAKDSWEKVRAKDPATKGRPRLDTLYKIRIAGSCIEEAAGPEPQEMERLLKETGQPPPGTWENLEPQDELIRHVIERRNGPDLRSGWGFGVEPGNPIDAVNLAARDHPVRAYHPIFVHDALGFARVGHVADLHINSRQHFLARTPARVVEASREPGNAGGPAAGSTPIGDFVNIYSDNTIAILEELANGEKANGGQDATAPVYRREPIDVLLVGGDLIDHVKNVFPYGWKTAEDLSREHMNAADVWELVDLDDAELRKRNYQPFVDHLTFYSVMKRFCDGHQKPVFVVSGNHDAYEEPYGMSPRPAAPVSNYRANEGIPADHNLTFYEAILAFGESYADTSNIKALTLHTELFEWFYAILTPFSDYAVDLPKQRILGLAWGDTEGKIMASDLADQHGWGHLPRADSALAPIQVALVDQVLDDKSKKVLLFCHFTLVSYKNQLPNYWRRPEEKPRTPPAVETPMEGSVGTSTFSKMDWGTFEKNRDALYLRIQAAEKGPGGGPLLQCVFTGHSHRRGLYYVGDFKGPRRFWTLDTRDRLPRLGPIALLPLPVAAAALLPAAALVLPKRVNEKVYGTLMFPIGRTDTPAAIEAYKDRTPVIVSDSAGPVPRANVWNEFREWGSDRASGTFVSFSDAGVVTRVEPVQAMQHSRTRPRAAVAVDYLHVNEKRGIVSIVGDEFNFVGGYWGKAHTFTLKFHDEFARASVRVASATFHGMPKGDASFVSVTLKADPAPAPASVTSPVVTLRVDAEGSKALVKVLNAPNPRFLSLRFTALVPELERTYDFDPWNFEIDCELAGPLTALRWEITPKVEFPDLKLRRKLFPDVYGKRPG